MMMRSIHAAIRLPLLASLTFVAASSFAQGSASLASPDLQLVTSGIVKAIARLPDGSVVFAGSFSSVNGLPRANIAKLRANGTLDDMWNPAANGEVDALATDSTGNIYAGGDFTIIGGQNRNHVAKLSGSGSGEADMVWNASANNAVLALSVDSAGNVYAGGNFSSIGGQSRNYLAKLSGNGTGMADASWNPAPNTGVLALATDASGNTYASGYFTSIGGQNRNYLAKLSGNGMGMADVSWDPSPNALVYALTTDTSGNIYAGGEFSYISGVNRSKLAKLSTGGAGSADATWDPSANRSVLSLATDSSGNVYAGGNFSTIGGMNRNNIAKLSGNGTGATDPSWSPAASGSVLALSANQNGDVIAGGYFNSIGGQQRLALAILSSNGTLGASMDAEIPGIVWAVAKQSGGGIIVGGIFLKANGQPRQDLLRIRADGTLDPIWNPSPDGIVYALASDPSGEVYVGGTFFNIGGQSRQFLARLSAGGTGEADTSWNPLAGNTVKALTVDASGSVYVGGYFTSMGGQNRRYVAKLSASGTGAIDATWNPSANDAVYALATDSGGNVYAGGAFNTIGGQARKYMAKLASSGTGTADLNWNPAANNHVYALATDSADNIYVGGLFTTIGGQNRNRIAKLTGSGAGSADPTWNPGADAVVNALALGSGGEVYAGGGFTTIGGQPRNRIAKLLGVGVADTTWDTGTNGTVYALAIDSAENLYAGGDFTTAAGHARYGFAAFQRERIFANGFE